MTRAPQTAAAAEVSGDRGGGQRGRPLDRRWVRLQALVAAGFAAAGAALMLAAGAVVPPLAAMSALFLAALLLTRWRPRAGAIAIGVLAAVNLLFNLASVWVLLGYWSRPQEAVVFLANVAVPLLALAGTVGLVGSLRRSHGVVAARALKLVAGLLLAGVGVTLVAGLADDGADATADATAGVAPRVVVADNRFAPATLTVAAGTTVEWVWDARVDHDVAGDGFASALRRQGRFAQRFDEPGDHPYRCSIHPGMEGTVTVVAGRERS